MSGNGESSSDEVRSFKDNEESSNEEESESSEEEEALSAEDRLFQAVEHRNATKKAAAQQAIRDGANVNTVRGAHWYDKTTPLIEASKRGYDEIILILLDAGAIARWRDGYDLTAIWFACDRGHLSTVELLITHDNGLLDMETGDGQTLLFTAVFNFSVDMVRFLLDCGADANHVDDDGYTPLMHASARDSLDIVRMLLAAGADVEARTELQITALHQAARKGRFEIMRELILHHNANMFAVDRHGDTPFDTFRTSWRVDVDDVDRLLEIYGNKLTQDHGSNALHELLKVAKYSFAEKRSFHPPLNPLQILLPLGKLTMEHLRTLLDTLDPELIRHRDGTGKLPVHIACRKNAPVEVLALILELDPAARHVADHSGALPIHVLCGAPVADKYASVRCLVEQGGVGTLAARSRQGLLPLHVLCRSKNPPLRAVQYLIQSFPGSVAMPTNAGQYPFMMAAAARSSSAASLSVIFELVRASPSLVAANTATPATASATAATAAGVSNDSAARHLATVRGQISAHPQLTPEQAKANAKRERNRWNAARARKRHKELVADLQRQVTHLHQRFTIAEGDKSTLEEQIQSLTNQNRRLLESYQGLLRENHQLSGNTSTESKSIQNTRPGRYY